MRISDWSSDVCSSDLCWLKNLIGATSLEEYFGLLRQADGCIGFPAGNTMMGPAFGVPTALIWNDHFDRRFHVNACRPGAPYVALNTALHDAEAIASAFLQTYRKTRKAEDRAVYEAWIATQENP